MLRFRLVLGLGALPAFLALAASWREVAPRAFRVGLPARDLVSLVRSQHLQCMQEETSARCDHKLLQATEAPAKAA